MGRGGYGYSIAITTRGPATRSDNLQHSRFRFLLSYLLLRLLRPHVVRRCLGGILAGFRSYLGIRFGAKLGSRTAGAKARS